MDVESMHLDKQGREKQCYRNASMYVMSRPRAIYVEGFAFASILPGFLFEHAWVLVKHTGLVIDPTWKTPGICYFGIPFTTKYLMNTLDLNMEYGMLPDYPNKTNPYRDGFPKGAIYPLDTHNE
jgi:hypothetical protein